MALKGSSHSNNQSNIPTLNQIVDAAWRLIRMTNVKEALPPRNSLSDIWRASKHVQDLGFKFLDQYVYGSRSSIKQPPQNWIAGSYHPSKSLIMMSTNYETLPLAATSIPPTVGIYGEHCVDPPVQHHRLSGSAPATCRCFGH